MFMNLMFAVGGFLAGVWLNQMWRDRIKIWLALQWEKLREKVQK